MKKRTFLKLIGSATLLRSLAGRLRAGTNYCRRSPSDAAWPSEAAWKQLNDATGGNLIRVESPLSILKTDPGSDAAKRLLEDLKNPYYLGDQPGLTQALGWFDAWASQPSVYAVVAGNAQDIAAAVNFARENQLRLVVKGGGHSLQGTSSAPDSLLIWTRHTNDITMHSAFVPQGCEQTLSPQPAVTVGAGVIGMQAYTAVTTQGGKYVQGGGCTTVGLAGLVQSGGFNSFSKHYGTAAGSLLEAEVVTADGAIRIANACTNSDLFWALKGGGGGSFAVISKMTLRMHELPELFGHVGFTVKAASDDAYRRLIRQFVSYYREHLFNDHWGGLAFLTPGNLLQINMLSCGLDTEQPNKIWQPFLDWIGHAPNDYSQEARVIVESFPARLYWDVKWNGGFQSDHRPGAGSNNVWWTGDTRMAGWFLWGLQSLWLPASLLESDAQEKLSDALFTGSRYNGFELQLDKGLAGAPPDAIAAARDTAMNPAALTAFAFVITGASQGIAYPGVSGHEPSAEKAHQAAERIERCMSRFRALVPTPASYVSESNYFEKDWQHSYWGSNYERLAEIKRKYDPDGLFFVHNGVGSEQWSTDGFTKLVS
jgi:FAD/FMN-containing dehydrogenase